MSDNADTVKEMLATTLLNGIDTGEINEDTLCNYSYTHLCALLEFTFQMPNGAGYYKKIKAHLESINIRRIRKKEKVIVGFLANYSSLWCCAELYELLLNTEGFEPWIYVMANPGTGQPRDAVMREYSEQLRFFRDRFANVIGTQDEETGEAIKKTDLPLLPDIMLWTTQWAALLEPEYHALNWGLDVLYMYIPYGIYLADDPNGTFASEAFNNIVALLSYQVFHASLEHCNMAQKYGYLGDANTIYTGYPKMDCFYDEEAIGREKDIWGMIEEKCGKKNMKRIIYAPHHSLQLEDLVCFSTFATNYKVIQDLALEYKDETIWVFKPHPQLKHKAIRDGIFANEEEWDCYVDVWRNSPNTYVYDEGDYHRLFAQSDAMILDSVSFLAEYLYVHKPYLLLSRKEQRFNDFGKMLAERMYRTDGSDFDGIREFIEETAIKGNDPKREEREAFFAENLDYVRTTRQPAAKNIFDEIIQICR